jgi:hypothetical protein
MFVVVVVVVANDVENAGNVVDFQWCPSNLHIRPLLSVDDPYPLETLCHVPFQLFASIPLIISRVEMSYVVPL